MRRGAWFTVLGIVTVVGVIGLVEEALAASADASSKLSQQVAGGGVTVIATLLKDQGEATAVKLVLETHSVNLDGYKWEAIATLRDENGRTYPVEAVENASGGGHRHGPVGRTQRVSNGSPKTGKAPEEARKSDSSCH